MGQHHKSNGTPAEAKDRAATASAAERIGDGTQLTAEDFTRLSYVERVALHQNAPEVYAALRDGRAPGEAWRPGNGGGGAAAMMEANL